MSISQKDAIRLARAHGLSAETIAAMSSPLAKSVPVNDQQRAGIEALLELYDSNLETFGPWAAERGLTESIESVRLLTK